MYYNPRHCTKRGVSAGARSTAIRCTSAGTFGMIRLVQPGETTTSSLPGGTARTSWRAEDTGCGVHSRRAPVLGPSSERVAGEGGFRGDCDSSRRRHPPGPNEGDATHAWPSLNVVGAGAVAAGDVVHHRPAIDLHAGNAGAGLCRYLGRPPIAEERLTRSDDGRLRYEFKRAWKDGTRAVILSPLDLCARVCALLIWMDE